MSPENNGAGTGDEIGEMDPHQEGPLSRAGNLATGKWPARIDAAANALDRAEGLSASTEPGWRRLLRRGAGQWPERMDRLLSAAETARGEETPAPGESRRLLGRAVKSVAGKWPERIRGTIDPSRDTQQNER